MFLKPLPNNFLHFISFLCKQSDIICVIIHKKLETTGIKNTNMNAKIAPIILKNKLSLPIMELKTTDAISLILLRDWIVSLFKLSLFWLIIKMQNKIVKMPNTELNNNCFDNLEFITIYLSFLVEII